MKNTLHEMGLAAREAAQILSMTDTETKNRFLLNLSELLISGTPEIIAANEKDVLAATGSLSDAMIDRLKLDAGRVAGIARDVKNVAQLPDPVGEVIEQSINPNGLRIRKIRVPIGVIAVIYESRPNVTVDSACLMVKSGNATILRGGKESIRTNRVFVGLIQRALQQAGFPETAVQFIDSPDRAIVSELLTMDDTISMIIPRGGAGLHEYCRKNSRIPVITGGIGICHLFVDASADQQKSIAVIRNAKVQRPTVCNALDTVLVDQSIARQFIPVVSAALAAEGVRIKADPAAYEILSRAGNQCIHYEKAGDQDFDTEWLSLVIGIKVVQNLQEAIAHIRAHSTGHSDGILTEEEQHAAQFLSAVNSSCVYHNASTRFTDGSELGLGAEIAISTQPLQARGPMALRELTTNKWIIEGDYHTRK